MQVFPRPLPQHQPKLDCEVRPCREVVLETPDLARAVTRSEKECVEVKLDRMNRDHAKRRPRPGFSGPSILHEKLGRDPILICKCHNLGCSRGLTRIANDRLVSHGALRSTAVANDY